MKLYADMTPEEQKRFREKLMEKPAPREKEEREPPKLARTKPGLRERVSEFLSDPGYRIRRGAVQTGRQARVEGGRVKKYIEEKAPKRGQRPVVVHRTVYVHDRPRRRPVYLPPRESVPRPVPRPVYYPVEHPASFDDLVDEVSTRGEEYLGGGFGNLDDMVDSMIGGAPRRRRRR